MDNRTQPTSREITFTTVDDIPLWMDLVQLVIDGFPNLQEEEHLEVLKRQIAERQALIMKDGEQAIGIMIINYATGSIDFLGVHPLYRKQGIAKAFLEKALSQLLKHKEVSITTYREGDRADTGHRKIWQQLGFAEGELLMEFGYPTQRMTLPNPRGEDHA